MRLLGAAALATLLPAIAFAAVEQRSGDVTVLSADNLSSIGFSDRPANSGPVADIGLDNCRLPIAVRMAGSTKLRVADLCVVIVHDKDARGSRPASAVARVMMGGLAGLLRLFGARPLPRLGPWSARAVEN